jgi:EpsI family protein
VVVFTIVVAVLTNLLRILTVLLFALKGNDNLVYDHDTLGYILYVVAFAVLLGFVSLIRYHQNKHSSRQEETRTSVNSFQLYWSRGFSSYGRLAGVAFILLLPAVIHARALVQPSISLAENLSSFPEDIGEWEARELAQDEWYPHIIGATDNLYRTYVDADGNEIRVFFSYLPIQKQGKELIYHANRIIPPRSRVIDKSWKTWTITKNPHLYTLKTKTIDLSNGTQDATLLYWYRNTDHYVHNKYMAKAYMALDSLLKNRSNGAVFVLMYKSVSYGKNEQDAKIQDFLNHFMLEISKYLPS